jgi:hypothetical protein
LTMYVTAGPGISSSTMEAAENASSVSSVGTIRHGTEPWIAERDGFRCGALT